jgi:hypothetical protein
MTRTSIEISLIGIGVFLILHAIQWRLLPGSRKGLSLLIVDACAAYAATAMIAHYVLHIPFPAHAPVSVPVYLFLGVCYFHYYFAVDRSVSVRTIGAMLAAKDRRMTAQELDALYPREEMIRRRIEIMLAHGWLTEHEGRFNCTSKARRLTRLARFGLWLYKLDASG